MSSLIKFSEATSLALHSLVLIVNTPQKRLKVKVMAKRLNASQTHLAKVIQTLAKSKIVKSVRGPAGGVKLNTSIDDLSFLDIYEAIEGDVVSSTCPFGKNKCVFQHCIFGNKIQRISEEMYRTFKKIKLSDFKEFDL